MTMFRFTIRDVLWLMVVVAFGAGWWASHDNVQRRIRNAELQVHLQAAKLAIATNENMRISNESEEYIVTPVCARLSYGLPYPPPSKTYQAEIQELEAAANRLTEERQLLRRQLWQATNKSQ
jgi:hypothetical protein